MNLSYILSKKTTEEWSLNDEHYDSLVFHTGEKPTLEQIELWGRELEEEQRRNEYKILREKEYPSEKELLIALWEMAIEGNASTAGELQQKRLEIKLKYPKP